MSTQEKLDKLPNPYRDFKWPVIQDDGGWYIQVQNGNTVFYCHPEDLKTIIDRVHALRS